MSKAASRLYLSQSAVSKRIAKLEQRIGKKLIEPDGRRIKLTADAQQIISTVGPSMAEIKGLIFDQLKVDDQSIIRLACSETLVAGYLAPMMGEYFQHDPHISLSTHHTPVIVEKIQSGDATIGFCAGHLPHHHGLACLHLFDEPFMIVSLRALERAPDSLLTNDLTNPANTYQAGLLQNAGVHPLMQMDSYTAAAQLALSGMAPALVPLSTIKTLNIAPEHCYHFPFLTTLTRPIHVCYRRQSVQSSRVKKLIAAIVDFVHTVA